MTDVSVAITMLAANAALYGLIAAGNAVIYARLLKIENRLTKLEDAVFNGLKCAKEEKKTKTKARVGR